MFEEYHCYISRNNVHTSKTNNLPACSRMRNTLGGFYEPSLTLAGKAT